MQDSRKKLLNAAARAMLILLVVAAVCLFSVSGLKREVTRLVQQTLPGLQYATMADSLLRDSHVRCLTLVANPAPQQLDENIRGIETATRQTDVYLEKYRDTIFDNEDQTNFARLQMVRSDYLRSRDKFFALLKEQRQSDALHYLKTDVTPAYNTCSRAMSGMFDHKVKIGEIRRDQVMLLAFITPIVVSILFVLLFVLGLLISFKFIVH